MERGSESSAVVSLRRRLAAYRLAIAALAFAVTVAFLWPKLARDTVEIVDLPRELARIETNAPDLTDASRTYYWSPRVSVHMHAMGRGQRCPLHIHPRSDEVTAIVSGRASVAHAFGPGREPLPEPRAFTLGDVIHSPPACAHEWVNPSSDAILGNLVVASPAFQGNLYVLADDPRLASAHAPALLILKQDLAAFAASGDVTRVTRLGPGGRPVRAVVTTKEFPLEPAQGTVIFIRSGTATLRVGFSRRYSLDAGRLAVLRNHSGAVVTPDGREPLAMLIVDDD